MGKMLISAWLAVASGKIGGRSLADTNLSSSQENLLDQPQLEKENGPDRLFPALKEIEKEEVINSEEGHRCNTPDMKICMDKVGCTWSSNLNECLVTIGPNGKLTEVPPQGESAGDKLAQAPAESSPDKDLLSVKKENKNEQSLHNEKKLFAGLFEEDQTAEVELEDKDVKDPSQTQTEPVEPVVGGGAPKTPTPEEIKALIDIELQNKYGGKNEAKKKTADLLDAVRANGGDVVAFLTQAGGVSNFVAKAQSFVTDLTDPETILEEFKKIGLVNHVLDAAKDPVKVVNDLATDLATLDYTDPNDALVTYLKNKEKSVPKKIIFGVFFVHAILFFGDLILTFVPIPNFLRWIASLLFGSSSILFMFTNGVAVWAAYTSESLEKTKKYYYVAGIYGIVQAADLITYFLGFGPLKIIYKFLSYGYKLVYLADAIIVTLIPLYFVNIHDPTKVGEGWTWLTKQFR